MQTGASAGAQHPTWRGGRACPGCTPGATGALAAGPAQTAVCAKAPRGEDADGAAGRRAACALPPTP